MSSIDNTYKPKVSVIIPVYNVKPYVTEALDSVINQTYKNLEIIVIDDGSNDGSESICDEYSKKDSRIKLIHQKNGGLSAARNTGLDNMTGEYVAFLDSDDAFEPEAIDKSLDAMLANDVDLVVFKCIKCKNAKNSKLKQLLYEPVFPKISQGIYSQKEALRAVADRKINFQVWNKLYSKYLFDNFHFPKNHVYEDVYTFFQILDRTNKIYVLGDILVNYRKRDDSICSTVTTQYIIDNIDSWSVVYNFIETHTPEVFDEEQLQKTRKKKFYGFVLDYAKILSSKSSEKDYVLNLIEQELKKYEEFIKIKNCCTTIRLVYYLMFNYPKLLSLFFIPCFKVYKFIKFLLC